MPRLPLRPPTNYLRDAMVATLAEQDVEFDVCAPACEPDPFLMPIENNGVLWPTKLFRASPQPCSGSQSRGSTPEQLDFAKVLSPDPWHSVPEHRPLGNQEVGQKADVYELSLLRQKLNDVEHYEPTGR